jgi:hypothetical protein
VTLKFTFGRFAWPIVLFWAPHRTAGAVAAHPEPAFVKTLAVTEPWLSAAADVRPFANGRWKFPAVHAPPVEPGDQMSLAP